MRHILLLIICILVLASCQTPMPITTNPPQPTTSTWMPQATIPTPEPTQPPVPKELYPQHFTDLVRAELNKSEWKVSNLEIETSFIIDQNIGTHVIVEQWVKFAAQKLTRKNGTTITRNIEDKYTNLIDSTTDQFEPMLFDIKFEEVQPNPSDRRRLFGSDQFCQFDDAGPTVNRRRLISGPDMCYTISVKYNRLYDRQYADNAMVIYKMSDPAAHVSREIALDTEHYVKIADNWMNRAILCAVLFWVVCGPFALVWAVMKYQKKKSYQKVAAFVETETEDDSK